MPFARAAHHGERIVPLSIAQVPPIPVVRVVAAVT